jgi:hypothetical protein
MRFVVLLLLVATPQRVAAQDEVPRIVQQGIALLRSGNCGQAFDLWAGHWPDPQKSQMSDSCSLLQDNGGALKGYDLLRVVTITPRLARIYLVLVYERQPIYFMFVAYKPDTPDWTINTINWNSDPDKVIPKEIVPPMRPDQ